MNCIPYYPWHYQKSFVLLNNCDNKPLSIELIGFSFGYAFVIWSWLHGPWSVCITTAHTHTHKFVISMDGLKKTICTLPQTLQSMDMYYEWWVYANCVAKLNEMSVAIVLWPSGQQCKWIIIIIIRIGFPISIERSRAPIFAVDFRDSDFRN